MVEDIIVHKGREREGHLKHPMAICVIRTDMDGVVFCDGMSSVATDATNHTREHKGLVASGIQTDMTVWRDGDSGVSTQWVVAVLEA